MEETGTRCLSTTSTSSTLGRPGGKSDRINLINNNPADCLILISMVNELITPLKLSNAVLLINKSAFALLPSPLRPQPPHPSLSQARSPCSLHPRAQGISIGGNASLIETLTQAQAGRNCFINSCTGSGKTLAYLVPILDQVLKKKDQGFQQEHGAVILTLNKELCLQIYRTIRRLDLESRLSVKRTGPVSHYLPVITELVDCVRLRPAHPTIPRRRISSMPRSMRI